MWSFFSRDPVRDFPYEIGESVALLDGQSPWQLNNGKRKGVGQDVSVFVCDSKDYFPLAKAGVQRLKTIRHPNIVAYVDSVETERSVHVVTERVTPLHRWLDSAELDDKQRRLAISWGLLQITKALEFLTGDAKLQHNNVCMSSVFVTTAGEWKLGSLEYVSSAEPADPLKKPFPQLQVYEPPEVKPGARRQSGKPWSTDAWGLGCLMWEVFNGPLTKSSQLKDVGQLPNALQNVFMELVNGRAVERPKPADVIKKCRQPGGFFNNNLIQSLMFIEEIQIKEASEKSRFFGQLPTLLDQFPPDLARHKILPQLMSVFEFGDSGPAILAPMLKLGALLTEEEYQARIVPCLVKLFASPDRATRVKLLQQLESFLGFLQPAVVNQQIFPQLVTGFLDTSPALREHTVRASLLLAPKLNHNNLNKELLKYFAQLQSKDDQGGIRTNTTVCISKIAQYLDPGVRQKVLISAFFRAMKDPFPPARTAGVLGLAATQNLLSLADVAGRVLPALCHLTVDPDKEVRQNCFRTIRGFLAKLEKVSEQPELRESMEADVNSQTRSEGSWGGGWAEWATGALSAVYKKTQKDSAKASADKDKDGDTKTETTAAVSRQPAEAKSTPAASSVKSGSGLSAASQRVSPSTTAPTPDVADLLGSLDLDDAEDNWGWSDLDVDPLSTPAASPEHRQPKAPPKPGPAVLTPVPAPSARPAPVPGQKTGWDDADWADLNFDNTADTGTDSSRIQRQKRNEEKRAAKKGPMKLGAKKLGSEPIL